MSSWRDNQRDARAYCEAINLDPDEIITGYWDTGKGHNEWITAARWSFYVGANGDWDRPMTGLERAMARQQEERNSAYAQALAKQRASETPVSAAAPAAKPKHPTVIAVMPGVAIQYEIAG